MANFIQKIYMDVEEMKQFEQVDLTELHLCEKSSEIDDLLDMVSGVSTTSKLNFLQNEMGVKSVAYMGIDDTDVELQYNLAKDIFLAGNWRSISACN